MTSLSVRHSFTVDIDVCLTVGESDVYNSAATTVYHMALLAFHSCRNILLQTFTNTNTNTFISGKKNCIELVYTHK